MFPPLKPLSIEAQQRMDYVVRKTFLLLNGFEHMRFGPARPAYDGEPVVPLAVEPRREVLKLRSKYAKIAPELLRYRDQGMSFRQLARSFGISVGYAHRLVNDAAAAK